VSESKERLLAAAKALFLARGYAATSVDAICEHAGLTKGSFYHFFDSKADLGQAVLEWSLAKGGDLLGNGPHNAISDPVEHGLAYLDHVEACAHQLWGSGCLLGNFALELAESDPAMQRTVSAMFQQVADLLAEKFAPVVAAAPPGSLAPAPELAEQFLGTLEGSIILAKAHRDPTRIPKAIRAFRTSLAAHVEQPV
jgi:TetR/AcrR family transcriptional repressor of nem operon